MIKELHPKIITRIAVMKCILVIVSVVICTFFAILMAW